jgi:hypothetical protein
MTKFDVDPNTLEPLNFALVKADEARVIADESIFAEFAIFAEIPTGCVGDEIFEKLKNEVGLPLDETVMESE